MKILYLEDNDEAVITIRRITAHYKHTLLVADSIEAGLSMLDEQPDLVLADMMLIDGMQLLLPKRPENNIPICRLSF